MNPILIPGAAMFAVLFYSTSALLAQDPLAAWGQREVEGANSDLHSIAYGNGAFIAVGNGSTIIRSTNGADWSVVSAGDVGDLKRVRFLNNQFFAVGTSDKLISSLDGLQWQPTTLPAANFWDIAAGGGVFVVAGTSTYVSANGTDWMQTHPMLPRIVFGPYETPLDTVVYGSGIFFALATGGWSPVTSVYRPPLISSNGVDWIPAASPMGISAGTSTPGSGDVLINGDTIVAAARLNTDPARVFTSTNLAASWCCDLGFGPYLGGGLAVGQGTYVWVSGVDSLPRQNAVLTSSNGINWEITGRLTNDFTFLGVAFGAGTFVAVGMNGVVFQSGNIGGMPSIIAQPQDRAAVVGNPAFFSVLASGAPPLAFQWYSGASPISNATNSTYTITNATTSHLGSYSVVISNAFGSVTSRIAQLTVSFLDINAYAGITILGTAGKTYRIDATSASGPANWQTLTNLVLPASSHIWIDYDSPTVGQRLYRAAELP